MAQVINNSDELLDGAQIANKLALCLKSGQSNYGSDDLELYDKGQIMSKYNINLTELAETYPDTQLIPHLAYTPKLLFKVGSTPKEAFNATNWITLIYIDNGFTGANGVTIQSGGVLYSEYKKAGENTPVSAGYYIYEINTQSQVGYYAQTNSSGVIIGVSSFQADGRSDFYQFWNYDEPYNVDLHDIRLEGQAAGWPATTGQITKRQRDLLWYDFYDDITDTWGNVIGSKVYVANHSTLLFQYRRIYNGTDYTDNGGLAYKDPIINSIGASISSVPMGGATVTYTIHSGINWIFTITAGSSFAHITSDNFGNGNGTVTVVFDANTGASRTMQFTVTDNLGISSVSSGGNMVQDAYALPRTEVVYYGYSDFSESDAWWSGYPDFSPQGSLWNENGTYYTTETGSVQAANGYYLTMVSGAPATSGYLDYV